MHAASISQPFSEALDGPNVNRDFSTPFLVVVSPPS